MENFATMIAGGANIFVRRVDGEDLCRAISDFACTSSSFGEISVFQISQSGNLAISFSSKCGGGLRKA